MFKKSIASKKSKHLLSSIERRRRQQRNGILNLPDVILSSIFNQIKLSKHDNIRETCRRFLHITNNSQKRKIKMSLNRQSVINKSGLSQAESIKTVLLVATASYSVNLNYSYLFNRLILHTFNARIEGISSGVKFDRARECLLKFYKIVYDDLNEANRTGWNVNKLNFCTFIGLMNEFRLAERAISLISPNHVKMQFELNGTWLTVVWTCMLSKFRFINAEGHYLLTILAHLLQRELRNKKLCRVWDTSDRVFSYGRNANKTKWKTICTANVFGSRKIMGSLLNGIIDVETIRKYDCCVFIDVTCTEARKWGYDKIHTFNLG